MKLKKLNKKNIYIFFLFFKKMSDLTENKVSSVLLKNSLQTFIFVNIFELAGLFRGINHQTNILLNNNWKNIIKIWLTRINVQTKFEHINDSQFTFLFQLYIKRIADRPDNRLLRKYKHTGIYIDSHFHKVRSNFDDSIFFSRVIDFKINDDFEDEREIDYILTGTNIEEIEISRLELWARKSINFNNVRKGDAIYFGKGQYNQDNFLIYNGNNLQFFEYQKHDKVFDIINFPIVNYFKHIPIISDSVWLSTKKELKLLDVIKLQFGSIYKYITDSNYIIYTFNPEFMKLYNKKESIDLSYNRNVFDDFFQDDEDYQLFDEEIGQTYDHISQQILYDRMFRYEDVDDGQNDYRQDCSDQEFSENFNDDEENDENQEKFNNDDLKSEKELMSEILNHLENSDIEEN
jgi:hypothetical protein